MDSHGNRKRISDRLRAIHAEIPSEEHPQRQGRVHGKRYSNAGFEFGEGVSSAVASSRYWEAESKPERWLMTVLPVFVESCSLNHSLAEAKRSPLAISLDQSIQSDSCQGFGGCAELRTPVLPGRLSAALGTSSQTGSQVDHWPNEEPNPAA